MLTIRFQRIGKKHEPHYRIVVAEKRSKLDGPPVEDLGSYNPRTKASTLNKDRVLHWVKTGAQPSVTVHNLLVKEGVIDAPKIKLEFPRPEVKETASEAAVADEPKETKAEEAPAEAAEPAPEAN